MVAVTGLTGGAAGTGGAGAGAGAGRGAARTCTGLGFGFSFSFGAVTTSFRKLGLRGSRAGEAERRGDG